MFRLDAHSQPCKLWAALLLQRRDEYDGTWYIFVTVMVQQCSVLLFTCAVVVLESQSTTSLHMHLSLFPRPTGPQQQTLFLHAAPCQNRHAIPESVTLLSRVLV